MSNSFGFGGNNGVLVFSKPETQQRTRPPEKVSVAVGGIGVIGPGVLTVKEITAPLPPGRGPVFSCGALTSTDLLTPNQRRRLSRLQQMALITAKKSHAPDPTQRVAVAIGTGLGCLEDAGAFIENLIAKDEREPMPSRFPNSVHNSPAGQVAIDQAAQAMNSAPTVGETTFECALWQGIRQLAVDEADCALVGAADEADKYLLSIGQRWGAWNDQLKPGEGAVVASLGRAGKVSAPLAHVATVKLGRYRMPFDAKAEADWIASAVDLSQVDVLLSGAGGFRKVQPMYAAVVAELQKRTGGKLEHQTYKQLCGEFHSASAFGFSLAINLAREQKRSVLLYTLSQRGAKALCGVQP
jgi:hypothetical protein